MPIERGPHPDSPQSPVTGTTNPDDSSSEILHGLTEKRNLREFAWTSTQKIKFSVGVHGVLSLSSIADTDIP